MNTIQDDETEILTADSVQVNVQHLYSSRLRGKRMTWEEVGCLYCLTGPDSVGNRAPEDMKSSVNEVTFFSQELFDALCAAVNANKCSTSELRRNILIEGVDLKQLVGKVFELHGVRFEGIDECAPDSSLDKTIGPGAKEFLKGQGGLRARILCDGWLRRGSVELLVWTT